METRAHTQTCPPRRLLAALGLLLALLVVAAGVAAGAARATARSHHASSCGAARHARHASARRCARHHAGRDTHKTKKPVSKPAAPAPKLTPAGCEDGTAPARNATTGAYGCEDGSEPACQDGSAPIRPSASSAPMCRVAHEGSAPGCAPGAKGECGAEFACEEEATEGPQGCEHGSAFEEEEPEA